MAVRLRTLAATLAVSALAVTAAHYLTPDWVMRVVRMIVVIVVGEMVGGWFRKKSPPILAGSRQGEFAVRLEAVGRRPFEVTVTIRKWTGMPYKDAQIVYDTAPSTVAARLTAQDAEALAAALRHVGATASVRGESGEPQA